VLEECRLEIGVAERAIITVRKEKRLLSKKRRQESKVEPGIPLILLSWVYKITHDRLAHQKRDQDGVR